MTIFVTTSHVKNNNSCCRKKSGQKEPRNIVKSLANMKQPGQWQSRLWRDTHILKWLLPWMDDLIVVKVWLVGWWCLVKLRFLKMFRLNVLDSPNHFHTYLYIITCNCCPYVHSSLLDYLAQVENRKNEPTLSDCVLS